MFLVELMASSFLDSISKQARLVCRCKRVLVCPQNLIGLVRDALTINEKDLMSFFFFLRGCTDSHQNACI